MLRREGFSIVFVCGCEITMFNQGIIFGEIVKERAAWLGKFSKNITASAVQNAISKKSEQLNDILREEISAVREGYIGRITYAAGELENIDWSCFDIT